MSRCPCWSAGRSTNIPYERHAEGCALAVAQAEVERLREQLKRGNVTDSDLVEFAETALDNADEKRRWAQAATLREMGAQRRAEQAEAREQKLREALEHVSDDLHVSFHKDVSLAEALEAMGEEGK